MHPRVDTADRAHEQAQTSRAAPPLVIHCPEARASCISFRPVSNQSIFLPCAKFKKGTSPRSKSSKSARRPSRHPHTCCRATCVFLCFLSPRQSDHTAFMPLFDSAERMVPYFLDRLLPLIQRKALAAMLAAFCPLPLPVSHIVEQLGFANAREVGFEVRYQGDPYHQAVRFMAVYLMLQHSNRVTPSPVCMSRTLWITLNLSDLPRASRLPREG